MAGEEGLRLLAGLLGIPEQVNNERMNTATNREFLRQMGVPAEQVNNIAPGEDVASPLGGGGTFGKILSGVGHVGAALSSALGNPIAAPRPNFGALALEQQTKASAAKTAAMNNAADALQAGDTKGAAGSLMRAGSVGNAIKLMDPGSDLPKNQYGGWILEGKAKAEEQGLEGTKKTQFISNYAQQKSDDAAAKKQQRAVDQANQIGLNRSKLPSRGKPGFADFINDPNGVKEYDDLKNSGALKPPTTMDAELLHEADQQGLTGEAKSQYVQKRKGEIAGTTAGASATARGQANANVPTNTTKTMAETAPGVINLANATEENLKHIETGPAASRYNEFMTGKIGAPDPEWMKYRTNLGLLQTLLLRMHVGARGGNALLGHFKDLLNGGIQSPENMHAALQVIRDYAHEVAGRGGAGAPQQAAPAGNAQAAPRGVDLGDGFALTPQ